MIGFTRPLKRKIAELEVHLMDNTKFKHKEIADIRANHQKEMAFVTAEVLSLKQEAKGADVLLTELRNKIIEMRNEATGLTEQINVLKAKNSLLNGEKMANKGKIAELKKKVVPVKVVKKVAKKK